MMEEDLTKPEIKTELRAITSLEIMKNQPENFEKQQIKREAMNDIYKDIQYILRDYLDTTDENYMIISLWIIGTYFHKNFLTYPYLFFNAMKGSAKTRTLKIIKALADRGDMLASLSEAVLFRTTGTLCIDEFERPGDKDKNALRELLNTAYKRGGKVKRMRKKKTLDGEKQEVEEFDTFRPISMANISGMEEVLGDRCISLILEKSNNPLFTKKVEDFDWNPLFQKVKSELNSVVTCSVYASQNMYIDWNRYINYTHTLLHTTTPDYNIPYFPEETEVFFRKINDSGLDGRNLEIFFPLIMMAQETGILNEFFKTISKIMENKKIDEIIESKDASLYHFVSTQDNEWVSIKQLTALFRNFCSEEQTEDPWLNPKWMGKALKRLNLIGQKRRIGEGIQVVLDIEKAKLKLEIFR